MEEVMRRQQETRLEVILEASADGILVVDTKGKVMRANRRFSEIWRIPEPLLACCDDKPMLDFVLAQFSDPDALITKVQLLYDSDAESFDSLTFRDGRVIERYSFAIITEGVRLGRGWSFHEVTERKRAEELLQKKNRKIERFTSW